MTDPILTTAISAVAVAFITGIPFIIREIAAWRKDAAAHALALRHEIAINTAVTAATDEKANALLQEVVEVKKLANGHSTALTNNNEKLELKLEAALRQVAASQASYADLVGMMQTLLETEKNDKNEIVRAIEINGAGGSSEHR